MVAFGFLEVIRTSVFCSHEVLMTRVWLSLISSCRSEGVLLERGIIGGSLWSTGAWQTSVVVTMVSNVTAEEAPMKTSQMGRLGWAILSVGQECLVAFC